MLGKLLKYEFKAMGRILLPLYAALFILGIVTALTGGNGFINGESSNAVVVLVLTLLVMAIFITTFILMINRFRTNLLGDEGYLWFTLPVSTSSHVWTKTISATLWGFLSGFVVFLTMFAMFGIVVKDESIFEEILDALSQLDANVFTAVIEILVLYLVVSAGFALKIYASISVGHLSPKMKGLCSFGAFVGFSIVESVISNFLVKMGLKVEYNLTQLEDRIGLQDTGFFIMLAVALVGCALYFAITWFILDRKLNLE